MAGDPTDLECVPATTRRAVVISTQLAPSYEPEYFALGRERMFAMLEAYYGPSLRDVAALHDRYGATVLWVRRDAIARELRGRGVRWPARELPFGERVRELARQGPPASLRLPGECRRFRDGAEEIYDLACVARRV